MKARFWKVAALLVLWGGIVALFWTFARVGEEAAPASSVPVTPTREPVPRATALFVPSPTPTAASQALAPEVVAALERMEREVADVRQLAILRALPRKVYSRQAWTQQWTAGFLDAYPAEEVGREALVLTALGWRRVGDSLWKAYYRLFDAAVARRFAVYDAPAQTMALNAEVPFDGAAKGAYVRAFVHALQAQNFAWQAFGVANVPSFSCLLKEDACRARAALTQGDALWSAVFWAAQYASPAEQRQMQAQTVEGMGLAGLLWFVQHQALFPYEAGLNFVAVLYSRGGWEAVNAAYAAPPVSSEQILHPERYPDVQPLSVTLPALAPVLGTEWEKVAQGTLGEWGVLALLAYGVEPAVRLDAGVARAAADGWDGDAYALFRHRESGALLLVSQVVWASGAERYEFTKAFMQYLNARTGTRAEVREGLTVWRTATAFHVLFAGPRTTVWIMAPGEDLARAVLAAVRAQQEG
ncbi:MAG TPA: hypothetical protein G4O04_02965 [Anaerolineae bacterium]|nr:hypothetical protein [Anaerolineae bacterium]